MTLTPASLSWFARHEIRLAWRDFFAMATGGKRVRGIVLLVFAVLWTAAVFIKHDKLAGALFIPYILWGCFAFWLNLYIVIHN